MNRAPGLILLVVCLLSVLPGCGAIRMVKIDSRPTGASIFVDGVNVGVTPKNVKLDYRRAAQSRKIVQVNHQYYKPGFQTWTFEEVPQRWTIELKEE